jgi:hypothetical protein
VFRHLSANALLSRPGGLGKEERARRGVACAVVPAVQSATRTGARTLVRVGPRARIVELDCHYIRPGRTRHFGCWILTLMQDGRVKTDATVMQDGLGRGRVQIAHASIVPLAWLSA